MSTVTTSKLQVSFGKNIKSRRAALGLSQVTLAARIGIRQGTLSDIEHGLHAPTLTTVERVAKALKVPAKALLS
jgi:transcriptional regulator with XRE-family HTH domain